MSRIASIATAGIAVAYASLAATAPVTPPAAAVVPPAVQGLQKAALQDKRAYDTLRSLTEQVGNRFAGSEGDRKAVEWALATLRAQGFANVRAEPVTVPRWVRGTAQVTVAGAETFELNALSLGGSVGTDGAPIEADVIAATTIDELERLTTSEVRGKIVFLYDRMLETRDGMDYSTTVRNRSSGAIAAA